MALIFSMWIEAETKVDRNAILAFFNKTPVLKTSDKSYEIGAGKQGAGIMVAVGGISRSGIQSEADAKEMTKIGFEFYKMLQSAPKFRYALVGVEVDEFRYWDELVNDPDGILLFKGLVIRKDLYEFLGSPGTFEAFKDNYLWTPYEGETYNKK
ncbi:MAG: hypothetical protein GC192_01205 [Bacteroidetes bacterium]|nr:hypothetical protein [Bacteroidota bacterium]